jgi:hypothetical protein
MQIECAGTICFQILSKTLLEDPMSVKIAQRSIFKVKENGGSLPLKERVNRP